jgi:DNA repair photolyase
MTRYTVYDGDTPIMSIETSQDFLALQFVGNDEWAPTVEDLERAQEKVSEAFPCKIVFVFSDRARIVKGGSEVMGKKPATGTREWAAASANCMIGCANSCLYCYAKANAIRFRKSTPENWADEKQGNLPAARRHNGTVMFPTSHDITEGNVEHCIEAVMRLVMAGNKILVVSKPQSDVIEKLIKGLEDNYCESFHPPLRGRILFRFTMGSMDPATLRFWEPGAPTFAERLYSLMWAFKEGWQTSVSMEPMLDLDQADVLRTVRTVVPYVTDAVWLGKANKLGQRCSMNAGGQLDSHTSAMVFALDSAWEKGPVINLYTRVCGDPVLSVKVKWKDSIKQIVGIEAPEEPGMDV